MKRSKKLIVLVLSCVMLMGGTLTVHAFSGCATMGCNAPLIKGAYLGNCPESGCRSAYYHYTCSYSAGSGGYYHAALAICDSGHRFY